MCDVTGKGSYPTRAENGNLFASAPRTALLLGSSSSSSSSSASTVSNSNSGGGFLSYLFEADESYNLDLNISYSCSGMLEGIFLLLYGEGNNNVNGYRCYVSFRVGSKG